MGTLWVGRGSNHRGRELPPPFNPLMLQCRGGFSVRGRGGGEGRTFPLGIRPPADPKGPSFGTFKKSSFGQPTLKFSKFCLWRKKCGQNRDKTVLWESSKNQFDRPKKVDKFSKFFENPPPPPLEKILDPPLLQCTVHARICLRKYFV